MYNTCVGGRIRGNENFTMCNSLESHPSLFRIMEGKPFRILKYLRSNHFEYVIVSLFMITDEDDIREEDDVEDDKEDNEEYEVATLPDGKRFFLIVQLSYLLP